MLMLMILSQGGQGILVDELYREAVDSGVVSPLRSFEKGLIDLHGHSSHMAIAALRYTFDQMLERDAERLKQQQQQSTTDTVKRKRNKELTVIVGKGGKLASVIQRELTGIYVVAYLFCFVLANSRPYLIPIIISSRSTILTI